MGNDAKSAKVFLLQVFRLLLLIVLGSYLVICVSVALYQRRMIYFPPKSTTEQVDAAARNARLERWRDTSGQAIGLKRLSPRQSATGRVLIVYGNASCATGCAQYADDIQNLAAFDVFILEYSGYADRPGAPTGESLFRAADQALQLLTTNLPIFLLGESLGSGVAAYLAGTRPERIAGLILLSPYDRLANVAQSRVPFLPAQWLLVDDFPSADHLRNYHGPVGIMVDGRDNVVPAKFGLQLYDGYTGPKRLWQFPGGFHITIMEPPAQFWGEVLEFWQAGSGLTAQIPGN